MRTHCQQIPVYSNQERYRIELRSECVSVAVIFLIIFIVSVKKGQFEDDESPAVRILMDSEIKEEQPEKEEKSTNSIEDKSE